MTQKNPETESVSHRGDVPLWNKLSYPVRERIRTSLFYFILIFSLAILVFPLFWMFSTSFRPPTEMFTRPMSYLPSTISLTHFESILFNSNFILYYQNSLIVAAGVVILTTVTATLGGYGLTRLEIPYKRTFARSVLFGYMFPSILLAIPMFIYWRQLGLINSYIGLILAETALSLPFSLWLMWKFFQTVPLSLEESAQMAGASRFRAFYEIALPMAKPGMIAVAVFSYAGSWNAYTLPRVLMPDAEKWPLTVGVYSFVQQFDTNWGEVMAASALILIPSFIFVFFLQKYLLRGFRAGGIQ